MAHAEKCPVCDGNGKVVHIPDPNIVRPIVEETCNGCGGKGWITVDDSYPRYYFPFNSSVPVKFYRDKIMFIPFEVNGKLPKEREDVIVRLEPEPNKGLPAAYMCGYLRYSGGEKDKPFFVTPGSGRGIKRKVTHWGRFLHKDFFDSVTKLERKLQISI